MNYYTNQYEFKYYLRDENGTIDEGFLLTDVVSGVNKIMAEVMDMHTEYATKGKANAGLTTGRR